MTGTLNSMVLKIPLLFISLYMTPLVIGKTSNASCPTVTRKTTEPYCPKSTHICPIPEIIVLSTITIPCGCPSTVPTTTSYITCPTGCYYSIPTQFSTTSLPCSTKSPSSSPPRCVCPYGKKCNCPIIPAPTPSSTSTPPCPCPSGATCSCPFSTPTTSPSPTTTPSTDTCFTITTTGGTACPTPLTDCITPDCIYLSTATISCGCNSIRTATTCASTCVGGCGTGYQTLALPCPTIPTSQDTLVHTL